MGSEMCIRDRADDVLAGTTVTGDDPSTAAVETGWYLFDELEDGEYQVEFVLDPANPAHAGLAPTFDDVSNNASDASDSDADRITGLSHIVDLDSAGVVPDGIHDPTIDAGYIADAVNVIGDFVWIDADQDGVHDVGELPLAGVIVELIDPVSGVVLATTVTDVNGFYEFTQLPDGQYQVCLLYTSPSPRDRTRSRMPSSA